MSPVVSRLWAMVVAATMALVMLPVGSARADTYVNVPDPELKACINEALGRWDDYEAGVTRTELASVTELNCFFASVRSLVGLEYATNLRSLDLSFNEMRSVQFPSIPSLEVLDLSYNYLTALDLTPVPGVKRLDITSNDFSSLDIRNRSALVEVDASFNSALAAVVLQNLPKLTTIDLSDGVVRDVGISGSPSLRHLDLRDNASTVAVRGVTTATEMMLQDEYTDISTVDITGSCSRPDPVKCSTLGEHVVSIWYGYYRATYNLRVDAVGQQFTDVPPGAPFYEDIQWMAGSGISAGYADGTYRPNANVHRAAMAAFMYRMAGSPAFTAPAVSPFKDVKPGDPFYKEIAWMRHAGISAGNPDGTYRPYDNVSRGAMAAFMYRAAGKPSFSGAPSFSDVKPGVAFYHEISWMAASGISTGYTDGTFKAEASVHRAAMAAFMHRLSRLG